MEKNKIRISTFALILVIMFAATLVALPTAIAQEGETRQTYAYVGAIPNPVGVNQEVLIHFGVTHPVDWPQTGWEDLSVTIKRPDGGVDTLGPTDTDFTGGTASIYVPDMVGTYEVQSHFPQQQITADSGIYNTPEGTMMLASDSPVLELVVQEDPLPDYPGNDLPDEYWTRPIDSQLREWYSVSGSWLNYPPNGYAPYNDYAPDSAHILWTKKLSTGGLVGGMYGSEGYLTGDAYEGKWGGLFGGGGPLVINGILYYNEDPVLLTYDGDFYHPAFAIMHPGVRAVDLHTGEEIWYNPDFRISFGQIYYYTTFNQHGAYAYIWETAGSTWRAYNPFNGELDFTIENASMGTQFYGPNGEILAISVDTRNGRMSLWNNTAIPALRGGAIGAATGMWRPTEKTVDGNTGYSWEVSIPMGLSGSVQAVLEDRVLGASIYEPLPGETPIFNLWGIGIAPDNRGQLLFNTTWTPQLLDVRYSWSSASLEDGVFVITSIDSRQHFGFSVDTGELLWGPTDQMHYLNMWHGGYSITGGTTIGYGRLFSMGYGGMCYCYNVTTGEHLWTYVAVDPYNEINWGDDWPLFYLFLTDEKIYIVHTVHSPIDPKPRGGPFICLDLEGDVVWRADGLFRGTVWGGQAVIGDSIIATMDTYDQRIYAIGKGPSKTTVTATPKVTSQGSSVIIEGIVTDVSPGTEDINIRLRFPNGVPAVADESMSEWMAWVYKQMKPSMTEGVDVFVSIQDPNGDYYSETVTADGNGVFSLMWTPTIVGEYHVSARFEESNSYYSSYATTTFGVDEAPDTGYQGPTAEEIASETAQRTISMLPPYPDVPTQEQVAHDAATRTIAMMPAYPTTEMPAYLTIDLVILILAAVGVVIGLIAYMALRKQK
jgi:hypothetical protein